MKSRLRPSPHRAGALRQFLGGPCTFVLGSGPDPQQFVDHAGARADLSGEGGAGRLVHGQKALMC